MKNIHDEVINELQEIVENGTLSTLRKNTREYAPLTPIKDYTPQEIKDLREKKRYTQTYFGEFLGVTLKTVQAWEAGTNKPTGTALRLFQVLEQDPHVLDQFLLTKA